MIFDVFSLKEKIFQMKDRRTPFVFSIVAYLNYDKGFIKYTDKWKDAYSDPFAI